MVGKAGLWLNRVGSNDVGKVHAPNTAGHTQAHAYTRTRRCVSRPVAVSSHLFGYQRHSDLRLSTREGVCPQKQQQWQQWQQQQRARASHAAAPYGGVYGYSLYR